MHWSAKKVIDIKKCSVEIRNYVEPYSNYLLFNSMNGTILAVSPSVGSKNQGFGLISV